MRFLTLVMALGLSLGLVPLRAAAEQITVFAAASLKGPLEQAAGAWRAATGHEAVLSFGGSSALAKQIEAGAPADLFLSASVAWMDHLDAQGLLRPGSRRDLFGNTLVLISADPKAPPIALEPGVDLSAALAGGRLAMALVDAVPAGQYGKEALTALGLWQAVEPAVVQTQDVRGALTLVTTGEAQLGVVYATDALALGLAPIATFPAASHSSIRYPGAVLATGTAAETAAQGFLDFLASSQGSQAFAQAGFVILP